MCVPTHAHILTSTPVHTYFVLLHLYCLLGIIRFLILPSAARVSYSRSPFKEKSDFITLHQSVKWALFCSHCKKRRKERESFNSICREPCHASAQKWHLRAHSCEAWGGRFMKLAEIWIKFKPFYTALLLIKAVCTVKTSHLNRTWIFKNFLPKSKLSPELDLAVNSGSIHTPRESAVGDSRPSFSIL